MIIIKYYDFLRTTNLMIPPRNLLFLDMFPKTQRRVKTFFNTKKCVPEALKKNLQTRYK